MAQVVLSSIGQSLGGGLGRAIGAFVGGRIDAWAIGSLEEPRQVGPKLEALQLTSSADGAPMACVFGRARVAGQVIWAARFLEKRNERSAGKGGPRTVDYAYSLSFAVALCEGPIDGVGRVWADGQPLDLSGVTMRVHRGTEDQPPDPLIATVEGVAPAYRGTAYVVFEDLPLGAFGNRPPQLAFEMFRRPRGTELRLEDRLTGVCLIPGAGEFALATQAVMRREGLTRTRAENVNNLEGRADLLASLDQLQAQCPNLERVNLVVGWFGRDLRAAHCQVRPGVERAVKPTEPMIWSVAGLERADAHVVSEHGGGPAYGGTPSDESVRQAVAELKARGLKVTLYPFVFMDIAPGNGLPDPWGGSEQPTYPWRGRITGEGGAAAGAEVAAIFGGDDDWGLRRMALHYAALAAECGADGLIVGSEMVGLTTLRDAGGGYPAVEALRQLAEDCRAICGPGVEISYAADWSEYSGHRPDDGTGDVIFHLDPLWADPAISYVGIDWYPPLTDWRDGEPDWSELAAGVAGNEAFDWFYASDADRTAGVRTPIEDTAHGEHWLFRAKDLVGWWSNAHHDRPGGVRNATPTNWVAGMKPIRLTEFGCAAVDRGSNAPNRFVDPKSAESGLPPFSTGARDDRVQRRALEAMLEHFDDPSNNPVAMLYPGRMVEGLEAWCWDARPFPDFPAREDVWADAANWQTGHWLNGRLAGEGRDLIAAVLKRGGLEEAEFVVEGVDGAVAGYVIDRLMTVRDALEPLLLAFGARTVERGGGVAVVGEQHAEAPVVLTADDLALPEEGGAVTMARTLAAAPETVRVRFVDDAAGYQAGSVTLRSDEVGGGSMDIGLSLVCNAGAARAVAGRVLAVGQEILTVSLGPLDVMAFEPADRVQLEEIDGDWIVERIEIDEVPHAVLSPLVTAGSGDDPPDWRPGDPPLVGGAPFLRVLDLPPLSGAEMDERPLVAVASDPWRPMRVFAGAGTDSLTARADVSTSATVGVLVAPLGAGVLNRWDEANSLLVRFEGRSPESRPMASVLHGTNSVAVRGVVGWEIIQFREAELVAADTWTLSGLLRGQQGTDVAMRAGASEGAVLVVLDDALVRAEVAAGERGLPLIWRAGSAGAPPGAGFAQVEAAWDGVQARPWSPCHLTVGSGVAGLSIRWISRARLDGDRWDGETVNADAMRFQVTVWGGGEAVRRWAVDDQMADYTDAMIDADFPGGLPPDARIEVAQWSPVFGWGSAVSVSLSA